MRQFEATVYADRYPIRVSCQASNWHTAVARVTRQWEERFKGSRADTLTIKVTRGIDHSLPTL